MAEQRDLTEMIAALKAAHERRDVDGLFHAALDVIFELTKARQSQDALMARRASDASRAKARRSRAAGDVPPSLRFAVLQRDSFACVACGATPRDGSVLEMDHIIPVAHGGMTIESNLQTLCAVCNSGKSDG